jgi:hypothetical protein
MRKVHLFDIDIPGKITFQESKTLSAGNHCTIFDAGSPWNFLSNFSGREYSFTPWTPS